MKVTTLHEQIIKNGQNKDYKQEDQRGSEQKERQQAEGAQGGQLATAGERQKQGASSGMLREERSTSTRGRGSRQRERKVYNLLGKGGR